MRRWSFGLHRNERSGPGFQRAFGLAAACLIALLALAPALAAKNGVDLNKTRITSDKVIYAGAKESIVFEGNVRVRRSDFDLWCQRMTVYLDREAVDKGESQGSKAPGDFEKIVAEEEVRLRMEGRNATCRKAVYRPKEETIILLGDVRLRQGRNRIRGEEVRMDMARNTTEILGSGSTQVEATFYDTNGTGLGNGASEGN
jgi:lipopolysaccharide export system protein LptA